MTAGIRLAAVTAAPADEAVRILLAAVRAEFRIPVLEPPAGHPVLTSGVCSIPGCGLPAGIRGWLCGGHRAAFYRQARRTGIGREEWAATNPPQVKTYDRTVRPCTVPWCLFSTESRELCSRHAQRWRLAGRPSLTEWANSLPMESKTVAAAVMCQARGCPLWGVPGHGYCRAHLVRFRRRLLTGRSADAVEFQSWLDGHGDHQLAVGHLPLRLQLEVQYAVQTYVDRGAIQLHLAKWNAPVDFVHRAGVGSVLSRSAADWIDQWNAARGPIPGRSFFRWAHNELDQLINGSGWDTEFPRNVWRVKRISVQPGRGGHMDFTAIAQPWLRELTKRWARHRLSVGLTFATAYSGLRASTNLGEYLHRAGIAESSPAEVTREHIDGWLATQR